ncbi:MULTISPECIES: TetR/AcrR family transcriptional regulator [unclassified Minwuia]|jgi:TetR/AcrR family transcriptional regulator, copper-responsive repressor|uniref:TetR/AcrR family transcriptional regulator n=1 Tax=unclassified Minwuia TaxID=2618799 RepID=UPI0024799C64|nr:MULTISPECIES: TetR/AcrR family transcriptional regulator [unclassified Minwuia]
MSDPDQKPARGRPRKMSSDAVLDVAMNAYWDNDPVDVSVNAICQMADVSKPSIYRTFGSEDGLTSAALARYAEQVLSDVFAILQSGADMPTVLDALVDFACADPRMETGCLFNKMRAGKHRLGPDTRARVDEIGAAALAGYADFLQARRDAGEWAGPISVEAGAQYLSEQIALAFTQRGSGVDPDNIRNMLGLALSVLRQQPTETPD